MRTSTVSMRAGRNVFFALLGTAGLLLERHYSGPHHDVVCSHGGNIAASFAVSFVVSNLRLHFHSRYSRLLTAAAALLVVELFEVTNGYGDGGPDPITLAVSGPINELRVPGYGRARRAPR